MDDLLSFLAITSGGAANGHKRTSATGDGAGFSAEFTLSSAQRGTSGPVSSHGLLDRFTTNATRRIGQGFGEPSKPSLLPMAQDGVSDLQVSGPSVPDVTSLNTNRARFSQETDVSVGDLTDVSKVLDPSSNVARDDPGGTPDALSGMRIEKRAPEITGVADREPILLRPQADESNGQARVEEHGSAHRASSLSPPLGIGEVDVDPASAPDIGVAWHGIPVGLELARAVRPEAPQPQGQPEASGLKLDRASSLVTPASTSRAPFLSPMEPAHPSDGSDQVLASRNAPAHPQGDAIAPRGSGPDWQSSIIASDSAGSSARRHSGPLLEGIVANAVTGNPHRAADDGAGMETTHSVIGRNGPMPEDATGPAPFPLRAPINNDPKRDQAAEKAPNFSAAQSSVAASIPHSRGQTAEIKVNAADVNLNQAGVRPFIAASQVNNAAPEIPASRADLEAGIPKHANAGRPDVGTGSTSLPDVAMVERLDKGLRAEVSQPKGNGVAMTPSSRPDAASTADVAPLAGAYMIRDHLGDDRRATPAKPTLFSQEIAAPSGTPAAATVRGTHLVEADRAQDPSYAHAPRPGLPPGQAPDETLLQARQQFAASHEPREHAQQGGVIAPTSHRTGSPPVIADVDPSAQASGFSLPEVDGQARGRERAAFEALGASSVLSRPGHQMPPAAQNGFRAVPTVQGGAWTPALGAGNDPLSIEHESGIPGLARNDGMEGLMGLVQSGGPSGLAPVASSYAAPVAQQIALALSDPARDPKVPLDIALDPPELGKLRLTFTETNGIMTLSISADRPETADLMRRHIALLTEEFSREGLPAPRVDISHQDGGANKQAQNGHSAPSKDDMPALPDHLPRATAQHSETLPRSSGLDIRL